MAVPDCPALHNWDEDTLIKSYFREGYTYSQICSFLELRHGIILTLDQLRGRLKKLDLSRRGEEKECRESGKDIGYRVLHQRLTHKYNFVVGRDAVMMLSAVTDPVGVEERKKQRLKRRIYHSKGPNYIWHVDGYDKLKPFGFPIHGCIDGILWLHVSPTNNDPFVVAGYYLNCIARVGVLSTENTNLAFLQPFLREDGDDQFAKEKSLMYGRSTSNQRIEAWWGQLRKNAAGWWMDYFKALRMNGEFDDSNDIHIDCLRFCFMDLIQTELATVAHEWNTHRIRTSSDSPDTNDYICPVDVENLKAAEEYSISKPEPVVAEFIVMEENGILSKPKSTDEALKLYYLLKHVLEC